MAGERTVYNPTTGRLVYKISADPDISGRICYKGTPGQPYIIEALFTVKCFATNLGVLYALTIDNRLVMRELDGTWTQIGVSPGSPAVTVKPQLIGYGGDLFVVCLKSSTNPWYSVYRWLNPGWFREVPTNMRAGYILFDNDAYLVVTGYRVGDGNGIGGRRLGVGSWAWGTTFFFEWRTLDAPTLYDDGTNAGLVMGHGYITGTTNMLFTATGNPGNGGYWSAEYAGFIWNGGGVWGGVKRRVLLGDSWSDISAVASLESRDVQVAGGKMYWTMRNIFDEGYVYTYDGSSWDLLFKNPNGRTDRDTTVFDGDVFIGFQDGIYRIPVV